MTFKVFTADSAPEAARPMLNRIANGLGFVPNMLGTMAAAPAVLEAYQTGGALFDKTSFTATERQIVMLTTSVANGCEYCVGAHSAISAMQKVDAQAVEAIRTGNAIPVPKLEALRRLTAEIVMTRGYPSRDAIAAFIAAGYGEAQLLEAIFGVGLKTIANYINHIAGTRLDEAFTPVAWSKTQS